MRALSSLELLDVWEQGKEQRPARRARLLLAAACPDVPPAALAGLTPGQQDGQLLTLRESTFGPHLACLATCPGCGERLELGFSTGDIRAKPERERPEELALSVAGHEVRLRLPTGADLEAIGGAGEVGAVRFALLERCLLGASHNGEARGAGQLPESVLEAIGERMAEADPQANVDLALSCPTCGHTWRVALDIGSFFWSEIEAWAMRTVREVHMLASAYGWSEADILALPPWRRQAYLEMVGA